MIESVLAFALVSLIAAQTAGSGDIPYFSQGVVGVSVVGALVVLWRFQRSIISPLTERANTTDKRLTVESRSRRECEWRLGELVRWLRNDAGLAVPDDILYGDPPWEKET